MMKKLLVVFVAGALIVGCKGKPPAEQVETTPVAAEGGTPVVETPMSFDAQGSDSGKIDGLVTVNFEYDKSALTADAKKKLQGNADWIKKNANVKVQVEGHCDNRGTIEYNLALGERRANSVKSYLVSLGVPAERLTTISYGEEKPVMSGESDEAHSKNRRANFVPLQ